MGNPEFMRMAIQLSVQNILNRKGGPFACVIVKDGEVIASGTNLVTSTNDPTAHAEVVAIRNACKKLETHQLDGCEIYTTCEPCPMCLSAIYWARPRRVIYANTKWDAAAINFDDEFIYEELDIEGPKRRIPCLHHPHPNAQDVFREWNEWEGKKAY